MSMKYVLMTVLASALCFASDMNVRLSRLPTAVQDAVEAQSHGSSISSVQKIRGNGLTEYNVNMMVDGRPKMVTFDQSGKVSRTMEQVLLSQVPTAARGTIEKQANGGQVSKIECIDENGVKTYSATINENGQQRDVAVGAHGELVSR